MDLQRRRFRLACRLLREAGYLDARLPNQKRNESPIDWMVRQGLALDAQAAAEALIAGRGLTRTLEDLLASGVEV